MPNDTAGSTQRKSAGNTSSEYFESEQYQRPRAEHIVFSFEKGLGNFVRSQLDGDMQRVPPKTIEQIKTESRQEDDFDNTIDWLVENSYLSTLLDLSVNAPEDADQINAAMTLRGFCEHVGIFEIRNVIAHPNRQWLSHYWHAVCALATHPTIMQLELDEVVNAVAAAESGQFEIPPDSWRLRVAEMEIPNNLSEVIRTAEHDTFVGRKTERTDLKGRIIRPTRMPSHSIVAAGGLGKTALLLACLRDIVRDHRARLRFDRVVFLSSKSRILTASGEVNVQVDIKKTQPVRDQLSKKILIDDFATWEQLVEIYGETRLLLCLDNVESILLEQPEPLEKLLLEDFPERWTIVVTSRVPVNHTSEFKLKEMTPDDKKALAFRYSDAVDLDISQQRAESLAENARSPLAIRIWIDLLKMGHEQDDAAARTAELTAKYAYEKLIEALEQDVRDIVEALFVIEQPVRVPQLCEILGWVMTRLKDAIVVAIRRFLVHRDDDRLVLHEALREHLKGRTDDTYRQFRNRVQKKWDRLDAEEQLLVRGRPNDVVGSDPERNFDDVNDVQLRNELYKIAIQVSTSSFSADDALQKIESFDQGVAAVHRVASMICRKRNDLVGVRQHLSMALDMDERDWRAATLLAHSYRDSGRYQQAIDCTRSFLECAAGSMVEWVSSYSRLVYIHYTSRMWRASDQMRHFVAVEDAKRELDKIIAETAAWNSHELDDAAESLAEIHAMALRRSVEYVGTASQDRADALDKALNVYRQLYEAGRTVRGGSALELKELIEQFLYLYNSAHGDKYIEKVKGAVSLIFDNIDSLLNVQKDKAKNLRNILVRFRRVRGGQAVVDVSDEMWKKLGVEGDDATSDDDARGIVGRIYHRPFGRKCVFVEDNEGTQYYVHASIFNPESEFDRLQSGMEVRLWVDSSVEEHGRSAVTAIRAEVAGIEQEILPEMWSEQREVRKVVAEIYNKPPGAAYFFAKDEESNEYIVHHSNFVSPSQFDQLAEGMKLQVHPIQVGPDHPHRAVPVRMAAALED